MKHIPSRIGRRFSVYNLTILTVAFALFGAGWSELVQAAGDNETSGKIAKEIRNEIVFSEGALLAADSCDLQKPGDVNEDGSVNSADLSFFVQMLNGGPLPSVLANADPNGDCCINESDLNYLTNFIFASGPAPVDCTCEIPDFPCCPDTPGDDLTSSLGLFRILVDEPFQPLMLDYPGYNPVTGKLTSGVLFDRNTVIGRSAVHVDGDASDVSGTPVGTAGTMISDADFSVVPAGFEGPAGVLEIHTEIRSLLLEDGSGTEVRAGIQAPGRPISPGEVEGDDETGIDCLPGESFFNVFVEVDLPPGGNAPFPGGVLVNDDPLLVANDNVTSYPPKVVYLHESPEAVKVYFRDNNLPFWLAGDLFGWLVLAGHGIDFDTVSTDPNPASRVLTDIELFLSIMENVPDICCLTAGDANHNGSTNIADAIYIINRVFGSPSGPKPPCCEEGDANGNGSVNIADAIYIINRVFGTPAGPAPVCGPLGMTCGS